MTKSLLSIALVVIASQARAEQIASETAKAAPLTEVEISGNKSEMQETRDFVSGRIIIDQQRMQESGAQNVGQVLRREPVITVGKDGLVGLMGLPGYTQILIDGQPSDGGDPLDLNVMQVQRIEIIKSATASTGPFGIAGTINIVRRKIARKPSTQLQLGAESAHAAHGASINWVRNQISRDTPLSYNLSLSADRSDRDYFSRYTQTNAAPLPTVAGENLRTRRSESMSARGVFSLTLNQAHKLSFEPEFLYLRLDGDGSELRRSADTIATALHSATQTPLKTASLPLKWNWRLDEDSEFKVKLTTSWIRADNNAQLREYTADQGAHYRTQNLATSSRNHFLDIDYNTSITGGHDITAGARAVRNQRENDYMDFIDAMPDPSRAILGNSDQSHMTRYQLFVQDDWRISRTLAAGIGLNAEHRLYNIDEIRVINRSRFTMWSPSMHVAKKLDAGGKHQLRLSLARTFLPPSADQMLLRPRISQLAPCFPQLACIANDFATADTTGNPFLQPERSLGINLSYTHKLTKTSEVGVELYSRDISNKTGYQTGFENVPWSDQPRYIIRSVNLGTATVRGIDLTSRITARDFWKSAPALTLSGSLGFAHSEVKSLAGSDNRISGQLPWRAKIAASYAVTGLPLKINLDANWLPADWVRTTERLRTYQSSRSTLNINASWKFAAGPSLVLSVDDLRASTRHTIDEYRSDDALLRRDTNSRADTRVALKLDINL